MTLTTTLQCVLNIVATKTTQGMPGEFKKQFSKLLSLAAGSGALQSDKVYVAADVDIEASGTDDYDLSGALEDAFGDTAIFSKIKAIFLINQSDDLSTPTDAVLALGGNAAALVDWVADKTDKVQVRAGGFFAIGCTDATAYAVTADTADILTVTNNDGVDAAQYTLVIVGVEA